MAHLSLSQPILIRVQQVAFICPLIPPKDSSSLLTMDMVISFPPSRHEAMQVVMRHAAAAAPPPSQHTDPQFSSAAEHYK